MTEKDLEIQELRRELQAYKDTGLKPEDVIELMGSLGNAISIMADYHLIGNAGNIGDIDHIHGLLKAEKDGRLVVLPCKVGDTVYFVTNGEIKKTEVESIHQWTSDHWKLSTHTDRMSTYWTGYEIDFRGIGKTVFLTREEAEAALTAKGEHDG